MNKKKKSKTLAGRKIKILVVDDHPIVRDGLAELLNHEADFVVCVKAGTAAEAIKTVKKQRIDLALVDMLLDHTTGVQLIKKIKAICPNIITLVFSMSDKSQYVKQAIEVGARGYITKDEISEEIVNAIRKILKGHIYISKRLLKNLSKEELSDLLADRIQEGCD